VSIQATYAMRASFASSDLAPAALKYFDALVDLLTGAQPPFLSKQLFRKHVMAVPAAAKT
jgi:hypothetical protein